ncbi:fasciclin domain-containing protein [Microbispora sp. NBC_01389]|uniref:fasciclin domain-containing protein n=1 Tax=Microbispora sp. NBC_01389 TaxID=2903584 RepID=UPI00386DCCC5
MGPDDRPPPGRRPGALGAGERGSGGARRAGGSACGDSDGTGDGTAAATASQPPATGRGAAVRPGLLGRPPEGEESFTGMADDPVATAASNNPVLSTLVAAVKKAGLVDTLNSADGITVFAPTDDAFAKIPKATLDKVLADRKTLT